VPPNPEVVEASETILKTSVLAKAQAMKRKAEHLIELLGQPAPVTQQNDGCNQQ
jgi:hypothetical protein